MAKCKTPDVHSRNPKIRRNYKDGLFRMIFSDKEGALELYNALNESSYTDPELLEITTIEDVIYMGFKNDLSFLVKTESEQDLYEAQSRRYYVCRIRSERGNGEKRAKKKRCR